MLTTAPTPTHPGRWTITRFGPPSVLQWQTTSPLPTTLPPRKALLRILVAGIAGPDNIQRVGGYPNERCRTPGFTPGYDLVGEIVALGDDCGGFAVGDRAAAMCMIGAHATHLEMEFGELLGLGKGDDVLGVCALPLNYMTAWGMLRRCGVTLPPKSSILIGSAAGGVGTAIAQLVKTFNMDLEMIRTCSPSKFDYVRSLGVRPVDRKDPNFSQAVRSLTNGQGVDVAYDAVGSVESLCQSLKSTKDGTGRLVAIGIMGDIASDGSGMTTTASADEILAQRLGPRMTYWGVERAYYQETNDVWRQDFYEILKKVRTGS
ncbi:hypothetical protein M409DRAFT_18882 [Zasmidium cellare ATCC 36951]|uniref:Enoyl reductase (ER) domain-containing protein n=1 Tax=Zasmidium cellare ATCC 36951 TaxID=1080233 RepID=A0A6A6CYM7_ZASCE|nr:uncharacterized protein M409DRAFT_18882 [Zasmidium cellare ATCC 36951]KAF2170909.1 hypothetical protein M409DRAFT_18882 [Zasmidium cellare ATCC 36951]